MAEAYAILQRPAIANERGKKCGIISPPWSLWGSSSAIMV
jgi:hypothetical protein